MAEPRLIGVYAGHGDTLLLETPPAQHGGDFEYWLIDGGPGRMHSTNTNPTLLYLKLALQKYCRRPNEFQISLLKGIVITHPDDDHMTGIIQLLEGWLPANGALPSNQHPLNFNGPIIVNQHTYQHPEFRKIRDMVQQRGWQERVYERNSEVTFGNVVHKSCTVDIYEIAQTLSPPPPGQVGQAGQPQNQDIDYAAFWTEYFGSGVGEDHEDWHNVPAIDSSVTNVASIITLWKSPDGTTKIATHGDGLASALSETLNLNPANPTPTLDVYKVPHHGSRRNSIETDFPLQPKVEGRHYRALVLGVCVALYARQHNRHPVYEDIPKKLYEDILFNLNAFGSEDFDPTGINRDDLISFGKTRYLQLEWTPNQHQTMTKVQKDEKHAAVWEQTQKLIQRYEALKGGQYNRETEITDKDFSVLDLHKAWKNATEIGWQARTNLDLFIKYLENIPGPAITGFNMGIAKVVECFYAKFCAQTYYISANGINDRGHPAIALMAGLIAANVTRWVDAPTDQKPARVDIVVTDGQAIKWANLLHLLTLKGEDDPQFRAHLDDAVSLWFFDNDFFVRMPPTPQDRTDALSPVPLSYNSPFNPKYLEDLHTSMVASLDQDFIRAADSQSSTFMLSIEIATQTCYLTVDVHNNSKFALRAEETRLSFGRDEDKNTLWRTGIGSGVFWVKPVYTQDNQPPGPLEAQTSVYLVQVRRKGPTGMYSAWKVFGEGETCLQHANNPPDGTLEFRTEDAINKGLEFSCKRQL